MLYKVGNGIIGIIFLINVLWVKSLGAQVKKDINFEMVLELGGARNLTISNYINQKELALEEMSKAKEWWVPEIIFGLSNNNLSGNVMIPNGEFVEDVDWSNQWIGVGVNTAWDIYGNLHNIAVKEKEGEITILNEKVKKNRILLQIISTYFDLAVSQMVHHANLDMAMHADSIVKMVEARVKTGFRYESELLMAKSNLAQRQLAVRESYFEYFKNSKQLTYLLNEKDSVQFVVKDTHLLPLSIDFKTIENEINDNQNFNVNLNQWKGREFKPEDASDSFLERPEISIEAKKLEILELKSDYLHREFLFPKLWLNTYGAQFGEVFQTFRSTASLNFGLSWKIPIARLILKSDHGVMSKKMLIHENKMEIINDEISKEIMISKAKVNTCKEGVYFANLALTLAEKAFQQSRERQSLGLAKPMEVMNAQDLLLKSKVDYFRTIGNYNKALYEYKVAKGVEL